MDKRVYKYQIHLWDQQVVELPVGAQIIHVDEKEGEPCLWAIVDPEAETQERIVYLLGTGQPPHFEIEKAEHIGTYIQKGGYYVWHFFIRPVD